MRGCGEDDAALTLAELFVGPPEGPADCLLELENQSLLAIREPPDRGPNRLEVLANMPSENGEQMPAARIVVIGNEKGGSGKSTVAMHLAIALMKSDQRVSTIDLDSRQKTFTHYIENRHDWALHTSRELEIPNHVYFIENMNNPTPEDDIADGKALSDQINTLSRSSNFIVIDTPGRNSYLGRLVLSLADILITPLNDSLVDLDVLGTIDRQTPLPAPAITLK